MIYKYDHPEYFVNILQPDYEKISGNIVIYGAGVNGAILLALLKKKNIDILCFVDDDIRKSETEYFGYPVLSREKLHQLNSDVVIFITPYISGTLFEKLRAAGYQEVYDCSPLFLEFEIDEVKDYISPILDVFHCVQTFLNKRSYINNITTVNHALTVVITERCTLSCRECMAFVPYYQNPTDYNYDELSIALDNILPTGVFPDIYLEGGEPFLHKDFHKILAKLISFKEVKHIWIITNGTIVPPEEILQSLITPKIIVWISDYGKNSYRMEELKEILRLKGIAHHSTTQHWYKVTKAYKYNRSDEATQELYDSCCKGLYAMNPFLIKGRIYRCQFHARTEEFGIIPKSYSDSIDILHDKESLKNRLEAFFFSKHYLEACKYCTGRGFSSVEVPVAEQTDGKLMHLQKIDID